LALKSARGKYGQELVELANLSWAKDKSALLESWENTKTLMRETTRNIRERLGQYVAPDSTPELEGIASALDGIISGNLYTDDDEPKSILSIGETHTYPHIDPKLKENAIIKYAPSVNVYASDIDNPELVLALFDTSIGNSGKSGMLFTAEAVYASRTLDKPITVKYADIASVEIDWNKKRDAYNSGLVFHMNRGNDLTFSELSFHKILLKNIFDGILEAIQEQN
jgi:hypothetical protein